MTSFVEQIAPLIQKHAPKYNIKVVSPIIAQAILESASGTSELAVKAHNYFGLKYRKGRCPTATGIYKKVGSEQMDTGLYVSSMMQWCKFPNMEDGVIGYFDFINVANYANLKGITSPEQYLINIKKDGYATSKNYVQNLMNVIGKYGLTKYDKKGDEIMAYTNSGLVTTKLLAPYSNTWGSRTHAIDTITIHCTAGQGTAYSIASIFQPVSRRASCNYSVGYDGSIGLVVEEKNASGCTSNKENDERAITIEVSTTNYHPYQCTDKAYDATIRLVADICKRNGIKQLKWSTNKSDRVNHRNGCNMTVHRDYENKPCPGDYLYNRMGDIASKVNAMLAKQSATGTMQQSALTKVVYDYTLYETFVSRYYGKGVDFDKSFGNQCLTSGHLVSMADGTYKPVEEVEVGDALLGGNTVVSNDTAIKEILKVETTFGTFKTTKDHRFIGEDGTEMRAKNLLVGEMIQVDRSEPEKMFDLTEDELKYLGFYLGDGTKKYRWKNSTRPEIFVTVGTVLKEEYLESLDVRLRKNNHSNGKAHTYSLVNKEHEELVKAIHYMFKKELPRVFTKEQYAHIIDGYIHADGSVKGNVISVTSVCKELLNSIQYGCTLNGWLAKISEPLYRKRTNLCDHPKPIYKLSIYKKQKPICKVVSVRVVEDEEVFVLNTDGNHLYYADNVLHHNCWDYVAQYAKVLGHTLPNCTQTGYVRDIANLKATNGILKWCDDIALNGQEMKKGDIIIWDGGQFPLSHIAIYTGRDSGNNGIYLGQNQPYPYGNERVFTSANMIGCFRPKVFKKTVVAEGNINYRVHCQTYGWLGYVYDGKMAGTTGKSKRVEAMQIYTTDGTVIEQVDAHMQSIGWKSYKAPNKSTIIGTTGKAKRLEALRIKTSKPCKMRGHVQKQGWGEWVDCDGKAMIGTTGKSLRLEAIEIKRV